MGALAWARGRCRRPPTPALVGALSPNLLARASAASKAAARARGGNINQTILANNSYSEHFTCPRRACAYVAYGRSTGIIRDYEVVQLCSELGRPSREYGHVSGLRSASAVAARVRDMFGRSPYRRPPGDCYALLEQV